MMGRAFIIMMGCIVSTSTVRRMTQQAFESAWVPAQVRVILSPNADSRENLRSYRHLCGFGPIVVERFEF